jgi:hypothetical protein
MKYCVGCGKKKRLRWEVDYLGSSLSFCSMFCAAQLGSHTVLYEQNAGEGYCPDCGEKGSHVADCPLNDEEEYEVEL